MQQIETKPHSRSLLHEETTYSPEQTQVQRRTTWRTRFSGWRGGVLLSMIICSAVLLLNILLAIISATVWHREGGIATAFTGNCTTAARFTTVMHLLINLLSSLLLGASNYCMQRLASPTRKEVDNAHAKKKWLDIGMPSVRNLVHINKGRALLWLLLGLSSIPLHFVYNSVVFETIAANDVDLLVVFEEFLTDKASWTSGASNQGNVRDYTNDTYISNLQALVLDDKYLNRSLFENITGPQCISRYNTAFITNAGTGFAILNSEFRDGISGNITDSLWSNYSGSDSLGSNSYEPYYAYCLSEIIQQKCQVQISSTILIVVIVCNVIKLLLMAVVLFHLNHETIVTIGDAIKSFLEKPDPLTESCCLMSRRTVNKLWRVPELRSNQRWEQRFRDSWGIACSRRRWIFSLLLYAAAIATASAFFSIIRDVDGKSPNGFGRVSTDHMIDIQLPYANSIISYVLLANLPQAIISFLYLTYNGLFTCMLANREWTGYAVKRASLRVTIPSPGQRSTYFLQLPYVWSVPLLLASVLLHWFVSQSIFLVRIAIYRKGVLKPGATFNKIETAYNHIQQSGSVFSGVGYSDVALGASIGWGSALVASCVFVAVYCKYPKGLPASGTNSAVISAACHVRYEGDASDEVEGDVAEKPLMWGVTIPGERDKIGHCCFSAREVEMPNFGSLYAGTGKEKIS